MATNLTGQRQLLQLLHHQPARDHTAAAPFISNYDPKLRQQPRIRPRSCGPALQSNSRRDHRGQELHYSFEQ